MDEGQLKHFDEIVHFPEVTHACGPSKSSIFMIEGVEKQSHLLINFIPDPAIIAEYQNERVLF